jgi:nucleoredoxin
MVQAYFLPITLFVASRSMTLSRSFCSSSCNALPSLLDVDGSPLVPEAVQEKLTNKRVAYYFAAGWCPMCTSFEPSLILFREAAAESGKPVELIYVSSDRSESDQRKRAEQLQMMSVPFDQANGIKRNYKIWAGSEAIKFGFGRRSGVPALVVLDNQGDELAFVAAESQGVRSLQTWPMDENRGIWR